MAQNKLSRTVEPGTFDAVSEADRAEQEAPAYPDDAPYTDIDPRSVPEDMPVPEGAVSSPSTRDVWHADPADIAEQSIPVPLEDDYDGAYGDEEP
ncbi:hypothetical protein [Nocardia sp. NPDC051750]|jgi:hypothetical protein|uniref:hypothetical protein n=1 Tax=Nocardia sp. NPDC051750 TaxID=3364325 RepID=UPI0037B5527A